MKKPTTHLQFQGFIFIILGFTFIIMGLLNKFDILKKTPHSIGEPKFWFPIIGIVLILIGILIYFSISRKNKNIESQKYNGYKTTAIITDIKYIKHTRWVNTSPYIIYFTYKYIGKDYNSKSNYYWENPNLKIGDSITIYLDERNIKSCYLDV